MQIDTIDDSVVLSEEKWNFYLEQNVVAPCRGTLYSKSFDQNKIVIQCIIRFSRDTIDSFRLVPLIMVIDLINRSTIPIIDMELSIPLDKGFIISSVNPIEIYHVDPSSDSSTLTSSISWQNLGCRCCFNKEDIEISPDNPDTNKKHQIKVHLSNEIIGIEKNLRIYVPILCCKLPKGVFQTKMKLQIKSDMKTSPITFETDFYEIPIVHIRKKSIKGKEVRPWGNAQDYEIRIFIENQGDNPLENAIIQDNLPKNFTFENIEPEPQKIIQFSNYYRFIWFIRCVKKGEKFQIVYHFHGNGDFMASEAQFTF